MCLFVFFSTGWICCSLFWLLTVSIHMEELSHCWKYLRSRSNSSGIKQVKSSRFSFFWYCCIYTETSDETFSPLVVLHSSSYSSILLLFLVDFHKRNLRNCLVPSAFVTWLKCLIPFGLSIISSALSQFLFSSSL